MANGAFKFKDNSGNVVASIGSNGSNIVITGGTLDLSGMTGLTLGNVTLSGTTQNATSASHAANYLLTSSFNSYTGTTNASARLTSIETITGSFATTGSNLFKGNQTFSGSLVPSVNALYDLGDSTHQFRHLYLSSASLYIDGTKVLGSTTQELQITTDVGQSFKILETGSDNITLQSADGNIEVKTSGGGDVILDPNTGVIALKGTATVYSGYRILSSDGNNIHFGNGITISGSILATGTSLVSGSSQISYTGLSNVPSGIISGSGQLSGFGFATTGSNNFQGTQTITGSLYVSANLVVQGSSSLQDVTGSNVYIGTNKINLNTNTPGIRFGGISVFDSGSNFGESGSLLWDSQNNRWLYQHPSSSGAPYKSAIIISGPMNSGSLGSESTLTTGKIQKAVGDDHIGDSIMYDNGSKVYINAISGGTSLLNIVSNNDQAGVYMKNTYDNNAWSIRTGTYGVNNKGLGFYDEINARTTLQLADNGNVTISGSLTTTSNISINSTSTTQLNIFTSSVSTQNIMSEFYNGDYTTNTRNFIRVRNGINVGSTMSSYFGQGQDGKTYIISNDFTKNHIVIDGNSTYVGINKNTPNSQLDVNGNTTVTGSLTTTGTINGLSLPNDLFAFQFLLMGS